MVGRHRAFPILCSQRACVLNDYGVCSSGGTLVIPGGDLLGVLGPGACRLSRSSRYLLVGGGRVRVVQRDIPNSSPRAMQGRLSWRPLSLFTDPCRHPFRVRSQTAIDTVLQSAGGSGQAFV